jgi:YfiH family protein
MIRSEAKGIPYYSFGALAEHGQIVHAVFTRLGGVSAPPYRALNVGHSVGDEPVAVETNHDIIYRTLGLSRADVVTASQVHSNHTATVDERDLGQVIPRTDALITGVPGVHLLLRFADCLPIFLFDPQRQVVALGHAGWRGTAAAIASHMVQVMTDSFGTDPRHLIASLGPAIGPCCYQVGEDVARAIEPTLQDQQAVIRHRGDSRFSLDLWEANRQHLERRGVCNVEVGRICTACHAHEFFSHRADRGVTGRFAALVGMRKPS